ncbi:DUF2625 family protein [Campylobacter concisus]|nr:DUF2625 family protein [Campylobacter concisus]
MATRSFYTGRFAAKYRKFYELYHWDDWREDVKNFSLDRMIFVLLPIL